jgi:1-deoxy-D-xylulose-5-phosphate reductoisomerase
VVLLGATGSIGRSALRVIAAHPDRLELVGIAAQRNWSELAAIAREFRVPHAAIEDAAAADAAVAASAFLPGTALHRGRGGLRDLATLPVADIVLVAVVGTAGLEPALAALAAGKDLALASKEILVLAGSFVLAAARASGARLLPVDSEHAAVAQCIERQPHASVRRIVLTASGGAFRDWPVEQLARVTPADALRHPNWSMGPKITVDSSTLVNKGLEVIEAHELFGVDYDRIDVVVHPQSIVHSMATFTDGATIAELSIPDMRLPIGYALAYPDRIGTPFGRMDFSRACTLEFEPPDRATFRGLDLAYEAGRSGGTAPAWLSAANEVAVDGFLSGAIAWADIAGVIAAAMDRWDGAAADSLDAVLDADGRARASAEELLAVGVSS